MSQKKLLKISEKNVMEHVVTFHTQLPMRGVNVTALNKRVTQAKALYGQAWHAMMELSEYFTSDESIPKLLWRCLLRYTDVFATLDVV